MLVVVAGMCAGRCGNRCIGRCGYNLSLVRGVVDVSVDRCDSIFGDRCDMRDGARDGGG